MQAACASVSEGGRHPPPLCLLFVTKAYFCFASNQSTVLSILCFLFFVLFLFLFSFSVRLPASTLHYSSTYCFFCFVSRNLQFFSFYWFRPLQPLLLPFVAAFWLGGDHVGDPFSPRPVPQAPGFPARRSNGVRDVHGQKVHMSPGGHQVSQRLFSVLPVNFFLSKYCNGVSWELERFDWLIRVKSGVVVLLLCKVNLICSMYGMVFCDFVCGRLCLHIAV